MKKVKKKEVYNCIPMGEKLTIAIDIDGTIADPSEVDFYKADQDPYEFMKAKPIKGALAAIKKLHTDGHRIVFYSSRKIQTRKATGEWLKKHGFPFHHLEMRKFLAHIYIDDRAISGYNWKHVMEQLKAPHLPGIIARRRGHV